MSSINKDGSVHFPSDLRLPFSIIVNGPVEWI